jgi:formate dehydrogenase major subunit
MVNPQRLTTVRYRAPYADHWEERPLAWAMDRIADRIKQTRDETFVHQLPDGTVSAWDYPTSGPYAEPSAEAVLKEINGYTWPERQQIASYQDLQDDGSTACGCWIYSGVYPSHDRNRARSRQPDGPDGPGTHSGVTWLSLSASAMPRASGLPRCNLFRATG